MSNPAVLTLEDVRAIADLARLRLTDDELKTYTAQLAQILDYFTLLQEVDTTDVPPTNAPTHVTFRDDVPQPPLSIAEVLRNAPDAEDDQFKVNAVLGDE